MLMEDGILETIRNAWKFLGPYFSSPWTYFKWKQIKKNCKSNRIIRKIHGSKMILDTNDDGISKQLILNATREELQTELIKKILKPGMNILDIGANIGYYALIESTKIGDKGIIFAIEPSSSNISHLEENVKINNKSNIIKIFRLAVSDKNGRSKLYVSSKSNLNTLIRPNKQTNSLLKLNRGTENIATTTVDNFISKYGKVNLIRMDVEGYEVQIFRGMKQTLKKNNDLKILFEAHPFLYDSPKKTVYKYLTEMKNLGYLAKIVVDRYGYLYPRNVKEAVNMICNYSWAPSVLLERKQ